MEIKPDTFVLFMRSPDGAIRRTEVAPVHLADSCPDPSQSILRIHLRRSKDAALDEENTNRIVSLIKDETATLGIQVLSISHHEAFHAGAGTVIKVGTFHGD